MVRLSLPLLIVVLMIVKEGATMAQDPKPVFEGDRSSFIRDVKFDDGTKVKPGERMTWTWEIKNSGKVPWIKRYLLAHKANAKEVDLKAIKKALIPETDPGSNVEITIHVTAPKKSGVYRVEFKMVDADDRILFPNQRPLFKEFVVE
jgi:uncharacterized membrane protein